MILPSNVEKSIPINIINTIPIIVAISVTMFLPSEYLCVVITPNTISIPIQTKLIVDTSVTISISFEVTQFEKIVVRTMMNGTGASE